MDSARTVHIPAGLRHIAVLLLAFALSVSACTRDAQGDRASRPSPAPAGSSETGASPSAGRDASKQSEVGPRDGRTRLVDRGGRRTASGRVPGYVELEAATIEGAPGSLDVEIVLASAIPERMSDSTTSLRVTLDVLTDGRDRYSFIAEANEDGWGAFAGGGADANFPGEFEVEGDALRMRIDRSYLGGAPTFEWLVNVAWTRGSNYGFDVLPVRGYARYPSEG